jgi:tRNA threonylcarbamoyladenosine biosynthesis protein TsaE
VGSILGTLLQGGERIGLTGDLGAGKTTFVRGLAAGLGIDPDRVRSPTFTLLLTYEGGRLLLHHMDLYRLARTDDFEAEVRELLYGDDVAVVEWAERLQPPLDGYLEIRLCALTEATRRLVVAARGFRYGPLLKRFGDALMKAGFCVVEGVEGCH